MTIRRQRPPVGSTDWAANQFMRLLRREAEEKAERARLEAESWRPSVRAMPFADARVFNDERNQVADLVQAEQDRKRLLAEEARRRVAARQAPMARLLPDDPYDPVYAGAPIRSQPESPAPPANTSGFFQAPGHTSSFVERRPLPGPLPDWMTPTFPNPLRNPPVPPILELLLAVAGGTPMPPVMGARTLPPFRAAPMAFSPQSVPAPAAGHRLAPPVPSPDPGLGGPHALPVAVIPQQGTLGSVFIPGMRPPLHEGGSGAGGWAPLGIGAAAAALIQQVIQGLNGTGEPRTTWPDPTAGRPPDASPRIDVLPPQRPEPPRDLEPIEFEDDIEEFPADPPTYNPLPPYPADPPKVSGIETFPIIEIPRDWYILERRGSPATQDYNAEIARLAREVGTATGQKLDHVGGAYETDDKGNRKNHKETYLKGAGPGTRGSNTIDVTIENKETERRIHFQSIDVRRDGRTPSTREERGNDRAVVNKKDGDIVVLVPKLPTGAKIDRELLKEYIRPFVEELNTPTSTPDPREGAARIPGWRLVGPPTRQPKGR
jgi:hypothetical protein